MKTGDKVCFNAKTVKRSGYAKRTSDMRGVVIEMLSHGKVARVDCGDTFLSEDGRSSRCIPTSNLSVIKNGRLPLSAVEPDFSDVAYEDNCANLTDR